MATATLLGTSGTAVNFNSTYTTGALTTASANTEVFCVVAHQSADTVNVVDHTLSGMSLTWEKLSTFTQAGSTGQAKRLSLWRGRGGSPSGTTLTVTLASTQTNLRISLVAAEVTGIDEDVQVQLVTADDSSGTGTSAGVTLAAFASAANPTLLVTYTEEDSGVITLVADSPMVMLGTQSGGSENNTSGMSFYDGNDTTPSHSWSVGRDWMAIGVELQATVVGGATPERMKMGVGV